MKDGQAMFDYEASEQLSNFIELEDDNDNGVQEQLTDQDQYRILSEQLRETQKELEYYKKRELEVITMGNTVQDGVLIADLKGNIIGINKIYADWIGQSEKEIIGKHYHFLKQFIDRDVCSQVIQKKERFSTMATLLINGKRVLVTGAPFFNKEGEFSHINVVLRDMTELIRLKEELEVAEMQRQRYHSEIEYLKKRVFGFKSESIGKSLAMLQLKDTICEIAKADVTVLITGETGVGKELVTNEIVKNSLRKDKPYIRVNCAAIPENLLESELFGYEKGAFTGALNKEKIGLFEVANSGTILLDEIGEMPISLQSKLLRVLQEREIRKVGGVKSVKLDVRVIAATNQDLEQLFSQGKFRQDLFYRLNVVPVYVPPLRERKEDIPLLVDFFVKKYNRKYHKNKSFDVSAVSIFEHYDWPGNVRELENMVERLIIFGNDELIQEKDITRIVRKLKSPAFGQMGSSDKLKLKDMINLYEKQIIEEVLAKYGSTHKAAKVLGVTQPTILRKVRILGIRLNTIRKTM